MKLLDRYILGCLVRPTLFSLGIFSSLWLVRGILLTMDLLVANGVETWAACLLFLYTVPEVLVIATPMACLQGTLLGMGRLQQDSELIAARGCGLSSLRLMAPALLLGGAASFLVLFASEFLVPLANRDRVELYMDEVVLKAPVPRVARDVFFDGNQNTRLFARRYDADSGWLSGVTCYEFVANGFPRVTEALLGHLGETHWIFEDGVTYLYDPGGQLQTTIAFARMKIPTASHLGKRGAGGERNQSELGIRELGARILRGRRAGRDTRQDEADFWFKVAFPFASFFLVLAATPLALRSTRGGGGSVGLAIVVMLAYYIVLAVFRSLGEGGSVSPFLGAWMPNLLAGGLGWMLVRTGD